MITMSSRPLPPLAIPSTLQDSLMARLDRLATVKEVGLCPRIPGNGEGVDGKHFYGR